MNLRTYFSLMSISRKQSALLILQILFLSGIGAGVYTYDQFFPDIPIGDNSIYGSTMTADNSIHWIEKSTPDPNEEVNSNLLNVLNDITLSTLDTDNDINRIVLMQEQNNHKAFVGNQARMGIYSYQNDIIVLANYKELYQFPILFRIQSTDMKIVYATVLELPQQSTLMDMSIDPYTGEILVSSVDLFLWGLWKDMTFATVTPVQFYDFLGPDNINSSTYLSEFQLDDVSWIDVTNQLPLQIRNIMDPIYDLSWDPEITPDSLGLGNKYRKFSEQYGQIDPVDIANILTEQLVEPQVIPDLIEIAGMYGLSHIRRDASGKIHGQGTVSIESEGFYNISAADYFVIDIENQTQWSWDLVDSPLITPYFDKVATQEFSDTIFYINHDASLDLRLDENYPYTMYDDFLEAYLNDERAQLQLGWFKPLSGTNYSLSDLGNFSIQPGSWIDISDRNFVLRVGTHGSIENDNIFFTPTISSHTSLQLYEEGNGEYHLHMAFGDVPQGFDTSDFFHNTAMYSYDLNLNSADNLQDYAGRVTTLREHTGRIYDNSLIKHGFPQAVHIRTVGERQEFVYFYAINSDLPVASFFAKIVPVGGDKHE